MIGKEDSVTDYLIEVELAMALMNYQWLVMSFILEELAKIDIACFFARIDEEISW